MSLMDSLLLDPVDMDIWVAPRTDGVLGSGTEEDPYDGSVRATPLLTVSSLTSSGNTATAIATNHGFKSGQLVRITGVSSGNNPDYDSAYYNGTFAITPLPADP